jgi:cytochrome c oxidase subunit 2
VAGKLDMIPGRENRLTFQVDRAGTYRGQCAEYCGAQHAHMALAFVAHEPAEFDRWLATQTQPASPPADPFLQRGQAVFDAAGCDACHAIRGTGAAGAVGPDLTHVGSRLTLAAGTLPNNRDALAAWISHSQEIKPGNFMPPFGMLPPEDLQALTAYLESLQ